MAINIFVKVKKGYYIDTDEFDGKIYKMRRFLDNDFVEVEDQKGNIDRFEMAALENELV